MLKFETEKGLEDFLMDHLEFLADRFDLIGYQVERQVTLGAYGTADIVATHYTENEEGERRVLDVVLFELKNAPLTHANVSQVARYKRFFDLIQEQHESMGVDFRAHLIGPKTFPGGGDDLVFLCQGIDWLDTYEFELDPMTGMRFKHISGWGRNKHQSEHIDAYLEKLHLGVRKSHNRTPLEA